MICSGILFISTLSIEKLIIILHLQLCRALCCTCLTFPFMQFFSVSDSVFRNLLVICLSEACRLVSSKHFKATLDTCPTLKSCASDLVWWHTSVYHAHSTSSIPKLRNHTSQLFPAWSITLQLCFTLQPCITYLNLEHAPSMTLQRNAICHYQRKRGKERESDRGRVKTRFNNGLIFTG